MRRNRSWCLAAGIVLAGILAFVFAAGFYYYYKYITPRMVDEKLVQEGPPQVLVYSPEAGDTYPAGTTMMAEAVVTATRPIERVEIWLDGALAGMQRPEPAGQTRFHASFQVEIGAGTHIVSWRAVDGHALVGQSASVFVDPAALDDF